MSQSHGHQIHVIHELVITCTPTKIVPWQIIVHLSWFLSGEEWITLEIFSNLYLNWLSLIDGFFYWYFYFGSFLIDWSFLQILIVLFFIFLLFGLSSLLVRTVFFSNKSSIFKLSNNSIELFQESFQAYYLFRNKLDCFGIFCILKQLFFESYIKKILP